VFGKSAFVRSFLPFYLTRRYASTQGGTEHLASGLSTYYIHQISYFLTLAVLPCLWHIGIASHSCAAASSEQPTSHLQVLGLPPHPTPSNSGSHQQLSPFSLHFERIITPTIARTTSNDIQSSRLTLSVD
jgi:hypothetical protein